MTEGSGQKRSKQGGGRLRRAGRTALDVAVGGTALAADKALETAEDTLDRVEDLAHRAEEEAERLTGRVRRQARRGTREARETAKEARRTARRKVAGSDARPYEERTRDELYELAAERGIEGRSRMRKAELVRALRKAR